MKFLFSVVFSVLSFSALAQVSVGFRSGLHHEFALEQAWEGPGRDSYWYYEGPATDLNSEVFANYSSKRWLFSLSLIRHKEALDYSYSYEGYSHWTGEYIDVDAHTVGSRTTYYFNTSAAYDCSFWKSKRLRTYFGLGISPMLTGYNARTYETANGESSTEAYKDSNWELRVGVVNTNTYALNKHVSLVTEIAFRTNGNFTGFAPFYQTNTLLTAQLGVSYKITP